MVDFVPVEILGEIFRVAQNHDFVFADHATVTENERIATVVSQVCQHWRNAAVGFPALWAYVAYESRESDCLPRMAEHLLRAKDQPLTFSLRLTDPERDTQYSDVVELLKNHLSQIAHLTLQEGGTQLLMLTMMYGIIARRLQSLSLDYKKHYHVWSMIKSIFPRRGICDFPYLQHLDLCRVTFDSFDALLPNGLTTLNLSSIRFPRPSALAPIAKRITSLTLGPHLNSFEEHFTAPVVFPALEKLVVKDFGYFPHAILPPNLRQLEMLDFRLSSFLNFLMTLPASWTPPPPRSSEITSSVDICITDSREDDTWRAEIPSLYGILSDLFEALPNAQNLRLVTSKLAIVQMWAKVLSRGEENEPSTWPWPNLRSITLADESARAEMFFALPECRRGPFTLGHPKDNCIILLQPDREDSAANVRDTSSL